MLEPPPPPRPGPEELGLEVQHEEESEADAGTQTNDSARQHMASALPDVVSEQSEDRGSTEPPAEETAESEPVEVVMSRPPAEVVQLDNFRKK